MNLLLLQSIIITSASVLAFLIGFVNLFKSKRGYFYPFAVLGLFGFAVGRIFCLLLEITGENNYVFSLGSLGIISGFLCLMFAGQTINKVDGGDVKNTKKYSVIALIMPVFFITCWLIMLSGHLESEKMIIPTLFLFSAMPCSYFCLKNIISPVGKGSFMDSQKPFFIVVIIHCVNAMMGEVTWLFYNSKADMIASWLVVLVSTVCYLLIPLLLERGNKKWTKM